MKAIGYFQRKLQGVRACNCKILWNFNKQVHSEAYIVWPVDSEFALQARGVVSTGLCSNPPLIINHSRSTWQKLLTLIFFSVIKRGHPSSCAQSSLSPPCTQTFQPHIHCFNIAICHEKQNSSVRSKYRATVTFNENCVCVLKIFFSFGVWWSNSRKTKRLNK